MKEHPIPQDITGYRFHIVGNMTIKQFAEIGGGFLLAAILYKVGFPPYIKYPLMVLSAGVGAAMAFLPIEERPLDHWIVTFVQVLFRPTQFYWRRMAVIPSYFLFEPAQNQLPTDEVDLSPARRERIHQFISSLNEGEVANSDYSPDDSVRMSNILDAFNDPTVNSLLPVTTQTTVTKPNLVVRVRQLREEKTPEAVVNEGANEVVSVTNPSLQVEPLVPTLKPQMVEDIQVNQLATNFTSNQADSIVLSQSVGQSNNTIASLPNHTSTNQLDSPQSSTPAHQIIIPASELSVVTRSDQVMPPTPEEAATTQAALDQANPIVPLILTTPTQSPIKDGVEAQSAVQFNTNLPFPSAPTEPNKLVGMVLSPQGDMVPGAIIEVVDENDNLARAVKSNALGQFFITTPLITGTYVIKVDKDELQFAPQELVVNNSILQPIELRATS